MTRHLIVAFLVAGGCSRGATPEKACQHLRDQCADVVHLKRSDVADCATDLPKVKTELGDAEYTKFLGCISDADSCTGAVACFDRVAGGLDRFVK